MGSSAKQNASRKRREHNRSRATASRRRRTRARKVEKGATYILTRRCLERRFLLLADSTKVNDLIRWCLALAAKRHGMQLHAYTFMSNHYHVVVTDVLGRRPAFFQHLNALLARSINALRGRTGTFWDGDGPHAARLPTAEDVIEDIAYTHANPNAAGLVKWGSRWIGVTSYGVAFGTKIVLKRPDFFFDSENEDTPEEVELELVAPKLCEGIPANELAERIGQVTRRREIEKQDELRKANRRFMGESRFIRQQWRSAPRNPEDRFVEGRRVSARCKWARIEALQRDRAFEEKYVECLEARERGEDVVFPAGTWALHVHHGVRVAELE